MVRQIRSRLVQEYPVKVWQWTGVAASLTILWAGGIWGATKYVSDQVADARYADQVVDWDDCMDEVRAHNILTAIVRAVEVASGPSPDGPVAALIGDLRLTIDNEYPRSDPDQCGRRPTPP
jgi:hypothetical protein